MNTPRFRHGPTQRLAEVRWWGCVLLAMFAIVQTARGFELATRSEPVRSDGPAGDLLIPIP